MQIGNLLVDNGEFYMVKSNHPNPKRIILIELATGRTFSVLKVIAGHWKPFTQDTP